VRLVGYFKNKSITMHGNVHLKNMESISDGHGIRGSGCFEAEVMAASYGDFDVLRQRIL
jgi:hypothetical protein